MQHGLPCMHTYILHGSINTKKSISPILDISHTHKKLHTTAQRKSFRNCRIEPDKRSHHHLPQGKGVDAVLQYFDDELLLSSSARFIVC